MDPSSEGWLLAQDEVATLTFWAGGGDWA